MIRATLDTNVLVSGLAGLRLPASTPGAIVCHWLGARFEIVISTNFLAEFERTLAKPYYRLWRSPAQIDAALRPVSSMASIGALTIGISGRATHPEDDLVLAAAVSAQVDYLVTGNKKLQHLGAYERIRIRTPRAFLELLEAAGGQ